MISLTFMLITSLGFVVSTILPVTSHTSWRPRSIAGRVTHPLHRGNQSRSESGHGKWRKNESVGCVGYSSVARGFPMRKTVRQPIDSKTIRCKIGAERMGTIMRSIRCSYWLGAGLGAAALLLVATAWADNNDPNANAGAGTPGQSSQSQS